MVQVRLFAGMRHELGVDVVELDLPQPTTVAQLRAEFARRFAQLEPMLRHARFAVDECYAGDDQIIARGAAVACIPPVSGG